jgi:hypothetical protein
MQEKKVENFNEFDDFTECMICNVKIYILLSLVHIIVHFHFQNSALYTV